MAKGWKKTLSSPLLRQNSFVVGIFICITLAEIAPWIGARGGPLVPEVTVKYGATFIIFLISGLTLKTKDLTKSVKLHKIHLFIQTYTFLFIPIFIQVFSLFLLRPFELNEWIIKGLVTVGCMPPPVSSAVLVTSSIGGNEAAAIFNSVLGSFLGIFFTPVLLLVHLGLTSTLPIANTVITLLITVLLPLFLGQIVRLFANHLTLSRLPLPVFGQIALLLVIYTSFCDLLLSEDFTIEAHHVLLTVFLVVLIQLILVYLSFRLSFKLGKAKQIYSPEDVIAIVFCSTHKSLTLGMPLLRTLYSGYPHLSQISLPLLVYHPAQIMLGFLIKPLAIDWLRKSSKPFRSHLKP